MREFENIPEMMHEIPPNQADSYTYYAGKPAEPSLPCYIPEYKKKKKKQPCRIPMGSSPVASARRKERDQMVSLFSWCRQPDSNRYAFNGEGF